MSVRVLQTIRLDEGIELQENDEGGLSLLNRDDDENGPVIAKLGTTDVRELVKFLDDWLEGQ